jgi:putative thioredoxin
VQPNNAYVIDVTQSNIQQVLEQSMQVPVIVDFWAEWCEPCKQMAPVLEKIVSAEQGKLILAKVNADQEQDISAQFGVKSLPTLKLVFQGKLVNELVGAQPEAEIRKWLEPVLGPDEESQLEHFLEQVKLAIAHGQGAQAEQAIRSALLQQPEKHPLRATLAEYLLAEGRLEDARTLVAEVTEDVEELRPFRNRFVLLEELESQPGVSLNDLAIKIQQGQAGPDDLYTYGLQAAAAGQFELGLKALIELLKAHRDFRDGAAKAALLKVFDCLPKGDPLASQYRRIMFNYLY